MRGPLEPKWLQPDSGGPKHGLGLKGSPECRLAPTLKQTSLESGVKRAEIFKFRPFPQSKSINVVCKMFQLLGDLVSQTPYRCFAPRPTGGLLFPKRPGLQPPNETR